MIAPEHKFVFSIGQSIQSEKVRAKSITWSGAVSTFSRHTRTNQRKAGKYFCAGVFRVNHRDKAHHQKSSMLTLDYDNVSESLPELMDRVRRGTRSGFLAYSTFRHRPEAPRIRVLIPLDRDVSADEYKALVESVAKRIAIPIDDCSHSAVQPMFFPKALPGAEVFTYAEDTTLFQVDSHLEQSGFLGHASSESISTRVFETAEADDAVSGEDIDFGLLDHEQILLKLIFASFTASGLGWQEWNDLICVVFHKFRGSLEARDLCQEWSAESDKHDPREIPRKWPTFSREPGETKYGFPKLKAMIENRGGPDPAGLEFLSELADSVSADSYGRITEGISSAPSWLLSDEQRDTLAQILHERVGVEVNKSLDQIGSELQPSSRSPDALQISRETKAEYAHRLGNASSEVELDRLIHNLAADDSIDQHYHLPELYPIIAAKRRELNLPLPNERQIKAQVESIRKQSGLSGSGSKPPYSGLIQRYSELAGWYQSKDTDELMLSKEHTSLKVCDVPLRSMDMENTFRREFYGSHKGTLDDKQISTIQSTIEALLLGNVPVYKVNVRAAELENGDILIDTHWEDGNNILVHSDGSGYSFTKEQLARFGRPPGSSALVKIALDEPYDRELIWQFWPGITDDEKLLVAARNIELYRPHTPTPLLAVISPLPGIGKTYRLKANAEIFDPCDGDLIVKPRNADDLAMALNQFNSVTIDNLTELGPVYQDMLCSAVTDGRYVKRKHHRNTDTVSAHVKCNVGATSIHEGAITNHDLWSRTIRVTPKAMLPGEMWQEGEWRSKLNASKGKVLAAHLRDMSEVLLLRATLGLRPISRLSDYEITGECLRISWGFPRPFSEVLARNQLKSEEDAHQGDIFLEELIALVHDRGTPFVMNASTVLYAVERYWQQRHYKPETMRMDGRPKGDARVGRILSQKASYLHGRGVSIETIARGKTRKYQFSLNQNADTHSIGRNAKAGMNLWGQGEFDEILRPSDIVPKTRTDEEWEALFKELDDNSDAATVAVKSLMSKAIKGALEEAKGHNAHVDEEHTDHSQDDDEEPPWMSI